MIALTDSIKINATSEKIFSALLKIFSNEENYRMWHRDHVTCRWLKGIPFEKGSVLYAEEYLHGKLYKLKFISTNLVRNNKFEYRLLFPASLICPKGSFIIEQEKENCIFTANLYYRLNKFFDRYFKDSIDAIEKHMKEEGENLKKIVEDNL